MPKLISLCSLAALAGLAGCSLSDDTAHTRAQRLDTGELRVALVAVSAVRVDAVHYKVQVPAHGTLEGDLPAAQDGTVSGTVAEVPAAQGVLISLSAMTRDGGTCSGEGTVSVVAGETTAVSIVLQCRLSNGAPITGGSIEINGALNVCPQVTAAVATPTSNETSWAVSASASDLDGDALTFAWSASSGTFGDATVANTSYACISAGEQTLTVTVDDKQGCTHTKTVVVTCKAVVESDAGVGGSDASVGGSDAGVGGSDGSVGGSEDGGVPSGPLTPTDPATPGPYGVVVEENVGMGFENPIDANDMPGNNQYCVDFALSFGQDEQQSRDFAAIPASLNMALYTLFRPANFEPGKKYPVVTWANGTCALPQGYKHLLSHVASHGFWVIAANSRFTGDGSAQLKGIDVMVALNKDANHAAFNRVDTDKVGVFGHSQGGLSTSVASGDARVDTAVILNSGGGGDRVPTYYVTGEQDLAPFFSELSYSLASAPAASINYKMSDHITLITEPMRIYPSVAAWFRYQLNGDAAGKDYFVGPSCKLCNHDSEWSYEQKDLK